MLEEALRTRRRKPVLLFDLAVPRDIEATVSELGDAYLYTVDDLERAVEDNRRSRREAASAAEAIIELQVARYLESQQASAHHAPPLKRLRAFGDNTRDELLGKARAAANGRPAEEVLDATRARPLTNRLLHPPTAALREAALSGDAELPRAAERLFPEKPGYAHSPARARREPAPVSPE